MKIKLLCDVPVERQHGLTTGRVFAAQKKRGERGVWVLGDARQPVRLRPHEYAIVPETEVPGEGE